MLLHDTCQFYFLRFLAYFPNDYGTSSEPDVRALWLTRSAIDGEQNAQLHCCRKVFASGAVGISPIDISESWLEILQLYRIENCFFSKNVSRETRQKGRKAGLIVQGRLKVSVHNCFYFKWLQKHNPVRSFRQSITKPYSLENYLWQCQKADRFAGDILPCNTLKEGR